MPKEEEVKSEPWKPAPTGFKIGNPGGGRKLDYETPEEMEAKVDEYFTYIQGEVKTILNEGTKDEHIIWKRHREPEHATITGLILYLGFGSKETFYEYEKRPLFSVIVKRARAFIEKSYELRLKGNGNVVGSIFALKNMGWKDKTELGMTDKEGNDILADKNEDQLQAMLDAKMKKLGVSNDEQQS